MIASPPVALDAQAVLAHLHGVAPGTGGTRNLKSANRSRLFNKKSLERHVLQKAKRLQQIAFNGSGKARTKDYLLPVGDVKPCLSAGKGRWETWDPVAVLRSAFAPSRASSRSGARDAGGSHKHVIDCSHVVSQCVLTRISDGMRRLRAASRRRLAQYQTNTTQTPQTVHNPSISSA